MVLVDLFQSTKLSQRKFINQWLRSINVYGFRITKIFIRRISDWVIACSLDIQLFQRNSVIKMMALVHKQFASPKYVEMWKYSWFKAGYLDEHPQEFLNPVDYCFGKRSGLEKCSFCEQAEFIRCSFCEKLLCFTHFWGAVDGLGHWCAGETVR